MCESSNALKVMKTDNRFMLTITITLMSSQKKGKKKEKRKNLCIDTPKMFL